MYFHLSKLYMAIQNPDWQLSLINSACCKLMSRPSTNEIIVPLL